MIILVSGLPGSGKSYFASRLAEMLRAEYINSDRLRNILFTKRTYTEAEKASVYSAMLQKMETAIGAGHHLVLDATFHKKTTRDFFMEKAKHNVFIIKVWADENIIKERLKKSRPYSEADYSVHQLIRQYWEPLEVPHLTLESTNNNINEMLQKAAEYLNNDPRSN